MQKKKVILSATACTVTAVVCIGGVFVWRHFEKGNDSDGIAYVCAVADVNSAVSSVTDMQFSGVVEPQATKEVKLDTTKTVSEIAVQEGDHVNAGDALFTYDVESMQLELQQGNVEIERMQNEISSSKQQITQLETEKKSANKDDQLTYTTQIQSLETDIAKTEYDIKTKNIELEKLQNTIDHATVTAEISGTVQSLKTVEQLQTDGTDVIMKLTSDGEFRVKCTINEQNISSVYQDEPMILCSRVDDSTWKGTISEISTEADTSQTNTMYYDTSTDTSTTPSKYPFYVTLESSDGLMLGQHLLVSADMGTDDSTEKSGIWLYTDYVLTADDGSSYVWATDKNDRLEKRKVEIGQSDETMGDCEIKSGLSEEDKIAFPSDSYTEGMKTTTNPDEATSENDTAGEDDEAGDIIYDENGNVISDGVETFSEDSTAEDSVSEDAANEESVIYDESGNQISDGSVETFSEENIEENTEGGASDGT